MQREIYKNLLDWKNSPRRKPLILQGARQVGKTHALKWLGNHHFKSVAYVNFEQTKKAISLFQGDLVPEDIINELSTMLRMEISPAETLIFFDEIQECERALVSLKYFAEMANQYHIVAAGSLLGLKLKSVKTFPVGKVNFLTLYPLTFLEYLVAADEERIVNRILTKSDFTPFPEALHQSLVGHLRNYFFVGGMPEAVKEFLERKKIPLLREVHQEILRSYELDFVKHASPSEAIKIAHIWHVLPEQLAKENKKFIFSAVRKSARGRDFQFSLEWLKDAGLIHPCYQVSVPKLPLKGYLLDSAFKIYALDVGLLGALADVDQDLIVQGNSLFTEFHGALTENYVMQQLAATHQSSLFYWSSAERAEVDVIFPYKNRIWPLEVKAGVNLKSKSLKFYDEKFAPPLLSRTNLHNFDFNGRYQNYPLYAVGVFPSLNAV